MSYSLHDDDGECCCNSCDKHKHCHKQKKCKKNCEHKKNCKHKKNCECKKHCEHKKNCEHKRHCDCKKCDFHKPCKKDFEQSLIEFIQEAAHIENALANAINAEVKLIKEGHIKVERLETLIKLAIKKEMILEFLIEDITKACKELKKCK